MPPDIVTGGEYTVVSALFNYKAYYTTKEWIVKFFLSQRGYFKFRKAA